MQGYQVKFEHYAIGGNDYRIRSLLDRQQYADPLGLAARAGVTPAHWPLFGVVWPSARMLADIMSTHAIDDLRILEVGCGLALPSIVLHSRGADITASDYHPLVRNFLDANTALNGLTDIETMTGDWADEGGAPNLFDLIIGSDLLYERDHFDLLAGYIHRHAKPTAKVIIVDPGRGHAGKFSRKMQILGYSCSERRAQMRLGSLESFSARIMTYCRNAN